MSFTQKSILYILVPLLSFSSCSPSDEVELPEHIQELENLTVYSVDAEPELELQLIREKTFGDTEEIMIGSVGNIAVDEHGRVFIADNQQYTIHVFGPNANYISHIGRKGEGPGEFYGVKDLQINDHKLFAYDLARFRYHVFSLDSLSFLYTVNLGKNKDDFNEISDAHQKSEYVRNHICPKRKKNSQCESPLIRAFLFCSPLINPKSHWP